MAHFFKKKEELYGSAIFIRLIIILVRFKKSIACFSRAFCISKLTQVKPILERFEPGANESVAKVLKSFT